MYEAADTYTNMKVRFEPYRQQFVDLRTDAHIEVKGKKKKALSVFLFGDNEYNCIFLYLPLFYRTQCRTDR